jgi:hypothetical protein
MWQAAMRAEGKRHVAKHDIISVLGLNAKWVVSGSDLQVHSDP